MNRNCVQMITKHYERKSKLKVNGEKYYLWNRRFNIVKKENSFQINLHI